MKTKLLPQVKKWLALFILPLLFLAVVVDGVAQEVTIMTDKDDYAPGEWVIITGTGWQSSEYVLLSITHIGDYIPDHTHADWEVQADDNGDLYYKWYVAEQELGTTLWLQATGLESGWYAETTFTDGNIGFTTEGLPEGASISITVNYTKPNGNEASETFTITAPNVGPSPNRIGAKDGTSLSYSYPNSTVHNNITYLFQSSTNPSPFTVDKNETIILTYYACDEIDISTQPISVSTTYGIGQKDFTVLATGTDPLSYQWQVNTGDGFTDITSSDYSGTDTEILTVLKPTVVMNGYQYRCVVTNPCGDVTSAPATLTVTAKPITGNFTAGNKVYDGNTSAVVLTRTLNDVVTGDVVSLTGGTATFSDKNVGTGKTVTLTGATLSGTDAGNYTLTSVATTTADISKAALTVSITAQDKVYDATTAATVAVGQITGVLLTDVVTATASNGQFDNKNVGTGKTVTADIATAGADAGNYSYNATATDLADISKAALTVSITAQDKVYDATTAATVAVGQITGVLLTDVVTVTASNGQFDNKNVGTGKTVTADIATAGDNAGNYSYNATATDLADISKAALTVSITAQDKVYDATTAATVAVGQITGILLTDVVTATASNGQFDNKNVGTGKTVTADIATAGADAGNYSYNATATVTASITPKAASVTASEEMKYCGQEDPTFEGLIEGFISADNVTATYTRNQGESVGSYTISATLSPSDILQNYTITYNTAPFTILGVSIDASASSTPVPAGSSATLTASVTPAVSGVSVTFLITSVGYSNSITVETNGSGIATAPSGTLSLGVYEVEATAGSGCATSIAYIPVYDASGSFVTGGGWIMSPAGALTADPTVVGKANFGFVSKYKKGSNQVDGNTEFQFHAGGINFKSTFHEAGSLVISGKKATYRGSGTVNGVSGYKFTLVALDGQWNGGTGPDQFRIKITDGTGGVIYDNGLNAAENSDASTELGGGSIVIHEVKKKSLEVDVLASDLSDNLLKAYPNPFAERVFFDMQFVNDGHAVLEIFDMRGAKLSTLFDKSVEAGMIYRLEYAPTDVVPGILIYRLVKDGEVTNGRLIYQKQR